MKKRNRKIMVLMAAFLLFCSLSGCNKSEEVTDSEEVSHTSYTSIDAKDCYENAGFIEFVSGAEMSAEYTFAAENSETTEWSVYVFDEAFDDAFRYISQAAEPALVGDGTISVDAGQFVYVYCSANEFTGMDADDNAKLNISVE